MMKRTSRAAGAFFLMAGFVHCAGLAAQERVRAVVPPQMTSPNPFVSPAVDARNYNNEDEIDLKLLEKKIGNRSILSELLKSVKDNGLSELFRIPLPSILIKPISFLEQLSTFYTPTNLLSEINKEKQPEIRIMKYVCSYIFVNKSTTKKSLFLFKPFNPIIGEEFKCFWVNEDGTKTHFISEQVSHHPPLSAYFLYNESIKCSEEGFWGPKTSLSWNLNSSYTAPSGVYKLTFHDIGEEYIVKQPNFNSFNNFWGQFEAHLHDDLEYICEKKKIHAKIKFDCGKIQGYIYENKKEKIEIKANYNEFDVSVKNLSKNDSKFTSLTKSIKKT